MKFLVDVNLPKYFKYFNNEDFTFVVDINPKWTDQEIWEYASLNQYIILTKDTDFYNRFILSVQSPKIVYFQLGNQTLKDLHEFFNNNWEYILNALSEASLIIATNQEILIMK